MQVHDPSVIVVGMFVLVQGLLTLLSGRKAERGERARQDEITRQARTDAAKAEDRKQQNTEHDRLAADYRRVYDEREKAYAEIEMRDAKLASFGTNYPDMFALMAVPGAMEMLRSHRDAHRQKPETGAPQVDPL